MTRICYTDSLRAALALLLGLLVACDETAHIRLSYLDPDAVVLAFGDSLTWGTGAGRDQSYPAILTRLMGRTVINAGLPGELSEQGRKRLPALLDQYRPELLILCHGGNDLLRRLDRGTTFDNLAAMVSDAQQRGIGVLLIGVPAPALFALEPEPLYARLADDYRLVYAAEVLPAIESDNRLKSDRVHPNAAGYRRLAETLHALLQERGAL